MAGSAILSGNMPITHRGLLDPFSRAQAGDIARMPSGAAIDGRAPAAEVLGGVQPDIEGAEFLDEVGGVVATVRAKRDGAGPVGMGLDHLQRGEALGSHRSADPRRGRISTILNDSVTTCSLIGRKREGS